MAPYQVSLSCVGLAAVWRGDLSPLEPSSHAHNPQIMANMASMYAVKVGRGRDNTLQKLFLL